MRVELHCYLEAAEASGAVWWSESPDVPGFHATATHLQDLIAKSRIALEEILRERGEGEEDWELRVLLMDSLPETAAEDAGLEDNRAHEQDNSAAATARLVGAT